MGVGGGGPTNYDYYSNSLNSTRYFVHNVNAKIKLKLSQSMKIIVNILYIHKMGPAELELILCIRWVQSISYFIYFNEFHC